MEKTMVFIGTYTQPILFGTGEVLNGHGDGIYLYELNRNCLKPAGSAKTVNASFLVMDQQRKYLFCTNELKEFAGQFGGSVSSFRYERNDSHLSPISTRSIGGADPCHVELDQRGQYLYCANFMSGSVSVLPVNEDGSLQEMSCFIQHEGSSVDPTRQKGPHAHGVFFAPGSNLVYIPDLGIDKILCYRADDQTGHLASCPELDIAAVIPGEGPRHMVFHSSGKYLYINTEMGSTVHTFRYSSETGKAEYVQTVSTIPEGTNPRETSTAAIKLHPNGRLLYVSNRGHNSIATYRVNEETGMLSRLSIQPTGGNIPRDFDISPDGNWMVVAHQSSDDAILFSVNPENGNLTKIQQIELPSPICVRFYQV